MKDLARPALAIMLCFVLGSAAVADEFAVRPIRHLVTHSPVAPPAPPYVAPPQYSSSSRSYKCARGRSMHTGQEYRAFLGRYGAGQPDRERVPAWSDAIQDPAIPGTAATPAYISVLVALETDGSVGDALVECSTDAALDANVLAALKATRFHPQIKSGKFVAGLERIEYWVLQD